VMACPHCDLVLGASVSPSEYVAAMLRNIANAPERSPGARKVENELVVG
jgi:hypothetical protein